MPGVVRMAWWNLTVVYDGDVSCDGGRIYLLQAGKWDGKCSELSEEHLESLRYCNRAI